MIKDILFAIWFFLPAGVANGVPVLAAHIPFLRTFQSPLDAGYTFRHKRLLGPNKTWRGLLAGIIASTLTFWLQQLLMHYVHWISSSLGITHFGLVASLAIGPLFGFGALVGDAFESFLKRQRDIPSGHTWFPFDQVDYIVGGAIAIAPIVIFPLWQYVWLVFVWLILHMLATFLGYLAGLRERPI